MKAKFVLLLFCLLTGAIGEVVSAQVGGAIQGVVRDATGSALPGANVTVTNEGTAASRDTTTDLQGRFEFPGLPIGRFALKVSLAGFAEQTVSGITLETQQNREANFTLALGGLTESTTVSVESVVVEIERRSPSLGQVISSRQVADLPLNGRNFIQLSTLAPGAVKGESSFFNNRGNSEVTFRGSTSVSIQGMRENANDFLLDGVDNNELTAGGVSILPSVEGIQEFKILTNNYSAEYGSRGGGTVLVSTKSGSNAFAGSAFEFFRHETLDTRNYFDAQKNKYKQNQFGGSLGGPVVRDKTFFFVDYMGYKILQSSPVLVTVPTAKMRQGDFSESFPGAARRTIFDPATTRTDPVTGQLVRDPFPNNQIPADRLNPIALRLLDLYPLPQQTDRLSNNFVGTPVREFNQNYINSRIDQVLPNNSSLFVRYTQDRATQFAPFAFLHGRTSFSTLRFLTRARNLAISQTQVISPRLLNQVTFGYNYVRNQMQGVSDSQNLNLAQELGIQGANTGEFPLTGMTGINPTLGFASLGNRGFTPFAGGTRVWHFSNTLTSIRGAHTTKMGGTIRLHNMDLLGSSAYHGQLGFDQLFTAGFNTGASSLNGSTGHPLASLLLGLPINGTKSQMFGGYETTRKWNEFRVYLEDTWQARSDLTLSLGMAYNLTSPQFEQNNRQSNMDFNTGEWFIAGENSDKYTGVAWDKNNIEPRVGVAWSPLGEKLAFRGGYGVFHDVSSNGGSPGMVYNPPNFSELAFTADGITPQWTLSSGFPPVPVADPREYTGNLVLTQRDFEQGTVQMWNFNVQRELASRIVVTAAYVGTHARNLQSKGLNFNSAPAGPGNNRRDRRPYPQYNNFNMIISYGELDHNSVQLKVERRFSRGLYLLGAYTLGKTMTNGAGQGVGVGQGVRYYPYLPTPDADYGRSDTDVRHAFNFSYIWQLPFGRGLAFGTNMSGLTEAILGNWQINGIVRVRTGMPLMMAMATNQSGNALGNRPDQVCDGRLPKSERTVERWFDTSCFVAPAVGTLGNAPRTSFSGPGVSNVDLSVFKTFRLGSESRTAQFRVEVFNLFNTNQFATPVTNIGAVDAGQITSTIASSRQAQLALKLQF